MSNRIRRCLKSLDTAGFLRKVNDNASPDTIELLGHGYAYAKQLQQQWISMRPLAIYLGGVNCTDPLNQERFSFIHSKQFINQLLQHCQVARTKFPMLLKYERISQTKPNSRSIFRHKKPVSQLITDFFVEPHRCLEHFYSLQRESKIWWMRFSSNPSRYSIVPYDSESQDESRQYKNTQAIDIRATFDDASQMIVEELTLVLLSGQSPAVIRSVIEIEQATCALLLDGCDHRREAQSLLLNRVLAPYQCGIVGVQISDELQSSLDLRDLCAHMADVLRRAQLRLHSINNNDYALTNNNIQLSQQLKLSDSQGVPYALLLDEKQSLSNGLLGLRSRDTQLSETIHISDLPDYLLNIFKN